MPLYRYEHWDETLGYVPIAYAYNPPYILADTPPDASYIDDADMGARTAREYRQMEKRIKAGCKAYKEVRVQMRLGRINNNIDHDVYTANMNVPMEPVISYIVNGEWLSAYNALNIVVANAYLTEAHITSYRLIISDFITGKGQYDEAVNYTYDANGYILDENSNPI